ncbi:LegC family aminotransferase [Tellurirhabdus bombi]|uniref:LegC family aminotransferase n=1 Tax=Tellurirhabdus bombi TaxID=2907205 RepID=UPI001F37779C|nr:LegC family aminotransferase [Tellurirhabdus bombi]
METFKTLTKAAIPLCEPNLRGNEKQYIVDAIDSNWLSGGAYLNQFEKKLAAFTGASYVIGTSSGTTALHISLILAGVEPNDLVILPNLTFVATANAVKYVQADPILMDIDSKTWVMDVNLLAEFLAEQTYVKNETCYYKKNNRRIKAIIPVHLLGNMCDMQQLHRLAIQYGLTIVEDAACSLGSFQKEKHSGTFGLTGTLSFNSNKIITTGGGGAILTNDESVAKKAKHLITQAKSSATDYFHDTLGYNYRLVNPLAAIGTAQMELLPQFLQIKQQITDNYKRALEGLPVQFQEITLGTVSNAWHCALLTRKRSDLISFLASENIESRPLWIPINELPIFKNDAYINRNNNAKKVSESGIMLPCSTSATNEQIERVCESVIAFLTK